MTVLLGVHHLARRFGGLKAVDDVSFELAPGGITALVGPNGAGKTTAFNLLSGFLRADSGVVMFDGARIDRLGPHRIVKHGLARSFQIPRILARMSVIENVMLASFDQPGEILGMALVRPSMVARREALVRDRAGRLLEVVKLDRLASDYAGTLSGGQRKLLEFARVMMVEPRMILLDEPMAGVAPGLRLELGDHIQRLVRDEGVTFLIIEHDMEVVMSISDRVIVMDEGKVVADARPEVVQRDQRVIEAYLGQATSAPTPTSPSAVG